MKKYPKRVARFYSNKLNLLLLIPIILFLIATVLFRWFMEDKTQASLKEQTFLREQAITRSGAKSIESFLNLTGKSLILLAKSPGVASESPKTQEVLEEFVSNWEDTPIIGVVLSDKDGIIQYSSGKLGIVKPGTLITDRDYFVWAKNAREGEFLVGEPILPRGLADPQFILSLATPVYQDGEFKGVLGAAILLSELTEVYLDPLQISQGTQVYLLSSDGVVLHSPYPKLAGENIAELLRQHSFIGNEAIIKMIEQRLHKAEEGSFELAWPASYGGTELTKYLLAYSPVRLSNQSWSLAIATPIDDTLAFYKPYRILKKVSFFIVLLFTIVFSVFIVLAVRIAQKNAFLNGFDHGKNHNEKGKRAIRG